MANKLPLNTPSPGKRGSGFAIDVTKRMSSFGPPDMTLVTFLTTEADGEKQHDALKQRLVQRIEIEDEKEVAGPSTTLTCRVTAGLLVV